MSNTPRTDAQPDPSHLGGACVSSEFARQLERELYMAEDAAQKGDAGRKLGTAFEECQKENEALRLHIQSAVSVLMKRGLVNAAVEIIENVPSVSERLNGLSRQNSILETTLRQCRDAIYGYKSTHNLSDDSVMGKAFAAARKALND